MSEKPRLLDGCSKAGGAGKGYQNAGFYVVGVDIEPQPRNIADEFIQADILEYLEAHGHEYDFIHVSPPCQEYSVTKTLHDKTYPKLIDPIRKLLIEIGKPYVIENVQGARRDMINPLLLCGSMFGLAVQRHRLFESNMPLVAPSPCCHVGRAARRGEYDRGQGGIITVAGHNFNASVAAKAMGIDWMNHDELAQAIPPAYTEWIGKQLLQPLQMALL